MTEERITETTDSLGRTHTTHTITHGEPAASSGGGARWALVVLALVALVAAVFMFSQMSNAEAAKDTAIAEAAGDVGDAAGQIGDAASEAGAAVKDAVSKPE
ncbi:hypothetical protein [Porphyrobacter sp. YT40]|uniref:hypothetical protein n=1 Tax=Porphyrobacter sp. YT40 TaxID=2547601 RepID=UPI0011413DA8|nr:hypothetical protein [Porphyrobacter sp. YT40]QDH33599.1 hypothetical protein E2E27_04155 [Porphyrobacter sp. YT40]